MRPEIREYHDYRAFLKDWLAYKRNSGPRFSYRAVSKRAKLSSGYLTLVLKGQRRISEEALEQLMPHLGLVEGQVSYLRNLRNMAEANDLEHKTNALQKLRRYRVYQELNPKEYETFHYFSHWHLIVIREMVTMPEFRLDPEWIRQRLRRKVSLQVIRQALQWLRDHQFIVVASDGKASFPESQQITCSDTVFRIALSEYHRQMLGMSVDAIEEVPREQRNVLGYTIGMNQETFLKVKELMDRTMKEVWDLARAGAGRDSVYHVGFVAFPLLEAPASPEESDESS